MNRPAGAGLRAHAAGAQDILRTDGPAAARIVVTVVAAWQVSLWLGADQPPVFAAVVPLVALRGDPFTALGASLQRVLGVVAGVVIAIVALNLWSPSTVTLALVVTLGLGAGMLLRAGGGLNIQVAASSLLVFASTSPDSYALHRLWETVAGAVVTIVLAPLLWPPDPRRTLSALAADCSTHLTLALTATTAALATGPAAAGENLALVNAHNDAVHADAARAREAARAMRFNPVRRRHREAVGELAGGIATADRLTAQLATLAREVVAFAGRDDLAADLARARDHLPGLGATTAEAIAGSLAAGDGHDGLPALARARTALAAYAHADSSPVAVVLRRPFQRILDDLDRRPGTEP
ncbi:FUSC family protein [Streptomyces sp. DSM 41634]|uniref:FUSC family protein n=1 Tax=Streptomyces sp. DSM 41634 TaxID=3448656 RepID=UPI00288837C8|nr:FUSC family protein [Streptomyces sp. DSM 41633]